MTTRSLLGCFLLLVAIQSQASAPSARFSYLEQAGFEMTSVRVLDDEHLRLALEEIEAYTSLRPRTSDELGPKVAVSGEVVILELYDSERPWETTFLFYSREDGGVLFMRARSTLGDPELRLWSHGPSEIVFSKLGARWQPERSNDTFRFGNRSGAIVEMISAGDALACLAKILGLSSTNWNSAISVLTNLTCNANSILEKFKEVQTLLHCFSMASVGVANVTSTAGCILGAAKLIGCGVLSCAGSPPVPSGLAASDGSYSDRVRVTWSQTSGASTYMLYRSESSGSIGSELATTSSTLYEDYSATAGKYYYYRLKACSTTGCSDPSGYDRGYRAGSSSACGGSTYTGYLSAKTSQVQPNGNYYESTKPGTHSGKLTGPPGGDFDLYLYRWNGSSWVIAAKSATSSNVETVSYSGAAGFYYWRVYAYSGSGNYTLCAGRP